MILMYFLVKLNQLKTTYCNGDGFRMAEEIIIRLMKIKYK